jgi:nucleotide-binding universal stress UspA family protein
MTDSEDPNRPLQIVPDEPKSIVVAVDASAGAPAVVAAGARISRAAHGSTIHIVHVFRTSRFDRSRAGAPVQSSELIDEAKDHLESLVRSARRQTRSSVIGHFTVGDPTEEIMKACTTLDADLLVIGTHDHVGFERLLLGSIAETLMRKVRCSVFVVRRRPHTA